MENKRTRNWATVLYPSSENTPTNWKEVLQEQLIPTFISPLHDNDYNSEGELKKEHHHIILMFEGVKTKAQVKEVFHLIGGVGTEPIKCLRAYTRYLCHLDNPDKAQYSIHDVICYAGADYEALIESASDKYSSIGEMIDFCEQEDIVSYADLIIYARENNISWFKVLCDSGTLPIVQFLKSRYWGHSKGIVRKGNDKRGDNCGAKSANMEKV